jgi:hypothetical protein
MSNYLGYLLRALLTSTGCGISSFRYVPLQRLRLTTYALLLNLSCDLVVWLTSPHVPPFFDLQGFRLPPGLSDQTPPSIFVNLTVLQLENITVQGSELGATLSRCPQLTQLELLAAIIQGSTLPLSVLNKLASLALSLCDVEQQDLPWGEPRLAFLGQLGSSLTSLSVIAEDAPMTVSSRVLACATNDLHRLTDLVVSSIPYAPHPSTIARLAQGPAAEHLEELVLSLNLPDMECLAHLIAMPKLGRLGGQLSLSGRPATVPPKPKVCWPQGKPPMQLHLDSAGVRLLTALPFECFSCVNVDMLYVEGDADRQEARHLMQALLAGAAKVRDFRVGDIKSHRLVDSGLSVLGPNCPLKHHLWCIHLTQLELDEADMQGIAAAWGPGLQALMLTSCSLTPEAWRAITPAAFPALSSMRLAMHFTMDLAVSVAAFCLEWPESHALSIIFARLPGHAVLAAGDTIALWRGLLRARGRCNPQLILGSQA